MECNSCVPDATSCLSTNLYNKKSQRKKCKRQTHVFQSHRLLKAPTQKWSSNAGSNPGTLSFIEVKHVMTDVFPVISGNVPPRLNANNVTPIPSQSIATKPSLNSLAGRRQQQQQRRKELLQERQNVVPFFLFSRNLATPSSNYVMYFGNSGVAST